MASAWTILDVYRYRVTTRAAYNVRCSYSENSQ